MKRSLAAAGVATRLSAPLAFGAAVVVYDAELGAAFATKRERVERVREVSGETAVLDRGDDLAKSAVATLAPRGKVPADMTLADVPADLAGRLPFSVGGTRWAKVGDHLVALREDGTVVPTVYDVLP